MTFESQVRNVLPLDDGKLVRNDICEGSFCSRILLTFCDFSSDIPHQCRKFLLNTRNIGEIVVIFRSSSQAAHILAFIQSQTDSVDFHSLLFQLCSLIDSIPIYVFRLIETFI